MGHLYLYSWAWKQPSLPDILNQNNIKIRLNFKFILPKKQKKTWHVQNKNPIRFISRKKQYQNKSWQENIPKVGVEQSKGNGKFYLYLYLLGT
jgi:hypothetical protein